MTKASPNRARAKFIQNHPRQKVDAMSLEAVSNQLTELVALSNMAWARQFDQSKAGELTSHLLAIQCARFLVQTKDPVVAAGHFHKLVLTHMLGVIPDLERIRGAKLEGLTNQLLQAGAIITEQQKN